MTLADAIAGYEAGPLALMAVGTGSTYRTWTRRLARARGMGLVPFAGVPMLLLMVIEVVLGGGDGAVEAGGFGVGVVVPVGEAVGAVVFEHARQVRALRQAIHDLDGSPAINHPDRSPAAEETTQHREDDTRVDAILHRLRCSEQTAIDPPSKDLGGLSL